MNNSQVIIIKISNEDKIITFTELKSNYSEHRTVLMRDKVRKGQTMWNEDTSIV